MNLGFKNVINLGGGKALHLEVSGNQLKSSIEDAKALKESQALSAASNSATSSDSFVMGPMTSASVRSTGFRGRAAPKKSVFSIKRPRSLKQKEAAHLKMLRGLNDGTRGADSLLAPEVQAPSVALSTVQVAGAQTFAAYVDAKARSLLHLPVADPKLLEEIEKMPSSMQKVIASSAKHYSIISPDPAAKSSIDAFDIAKNWDEHFEDFAAAGLPMLLDPEVNAFVAYEYQLNLKITEGTLREAGLSEGQIESWKKVQRGELFSPAKPPSFLPQPSSRATLNELAGGVLLRAPTSLKYFESLLAELPDGGQTPARASSGSQNSWLGVQVNSRRLADLGDAQPMPKMKGWPPSLMAITPKLMAYPDLASRKEALPWLLLDYAFEQAGEPSGVEEGSILDMRKAQRSLANDKALLNFIAEITPDQRAESKPLDAIFGASAQNQALRLMTLHSPRFVEALTLNNRFAPSAVRQVVARNSERSLSNINLIGVQHLLADNGATISEMQKLGLRAENTALMGIPYSTNEAVAEALRNQGFDVDTRERRGVPYSAWREVQVCELIDKALGMNARNGKPIVVMDDGGYATKALAKHYPSKAHLFTVVEQTTRGITEAESRPMVCDVVNVARSEAKQVELPGIAAGVEDAVINRLARFTGDEIGPEQSARLVDGVWIRRNAASYGVQSESEATPQNKSAVVLGFGWIGRTVAKALQGLGQEVTIVDPDPQARARAEKAGFKSAAKPDEVITEAHIIAGCTGHRSLDSRLLSKLENGQVVLSASSSSVEFEVPEESHFHEDLMVKDGKTSYVMLSGGNPINFTGERESGPDYMIQYTRAAMVEGIIQAAERFEQGTANRSPSLVPLDKARVDAIIPKGWRENGGQLSSWPPA